MQKECDPMYLKTFQEFLKSNKVSTWNNESQNYHLSLSAKWTDNKWIKKGKNEKVTKIELKTRKTVAPRCTNAFTDYFYFLFSVKFLITSKGIFYPVLAILIAILTPQNETTNTELMQINSCLWSLWECSILENNHISEG